MTHEEYGDPRQADVVEGYCSLERIISLTFTLGVVIIPVNAGVVRDESRVVIRQSCAVAHDVACNSKCNIFRGLR